MTFGKDTGIMTGCGDAVYLIFCIRKRTKLIIETKVISYLVKVIQFIGFKLKLTLFNIP